MKNWIVLCLLFFGFPSYAHYHVQVGSYEVLDHALSALENQQTFYNCEFYLVIHEIAKNENSTSKQVHLWIKDLHSGHNQTLSFIYEVNRSYGFNPESRRSRFLQSYKVDSVLYNKSLDLQLDVHGRLLSLSYREVQSSPFKINNNIKCSPEL